MKTIEEIREAYNKRTNSEDAATKELVRINKKLYNYAKQGKSYIKWITFTALSESIISKLTEEGYKVEIDPSPLKTTNKTRLIIRICE